MNSQSSIVEKVGTFLDEMIHITHECVMHLHGHQNKMVLFMKCFIFVDLNNGVKFRNYTCWSINDTQSHCLLHRVNNHHINNENLVLSGHVETDS
jgi:hypothetical protein